jgi:hypothetical protein
MFMEILRRKAENASGFVDEFSTKTTKLSQYCHKCGKYTKKPLSQRVHTCCNLNIQRDLYSAFLAGSVVFCALDSSKLPFSRSVDEHKAQTENKMDTADVIERWRSMEAILQRAVSVPPFLKGVGGFQVANGRQMPSSFGLRVRDRAARLRSSDVPESLRGIPDAKNRDVVAVSCFFDNRLSKKQK